MKPSRPPAFDAKAFTKTLYDRVRKPSGDPYAALDYEDDSGRAIGFPRFKQWLTGLRDVVNANAMYLDDVKKDLDDHKAIDFGRDKDLSARVTALEEAQSTVPFPGSG